MARLGSGRRDGAKIVLIDDDPELLQSLETLLRRDGHDVTTAADPAAGIEQVRERQPALVVLDYFMPGMTGGDVVREIRKFDSHTQVLLVTGYADQQPGRRLLAELDIQGYHDKGDGPDRLLVLVDAALKHYRTLQRIWRHSEMLEAILEAAPEIGLLQQQTALFAKALHHLQRLLECAGDGLIATENHGLFVMQDVTQGICVRARVGKYAQQDAEGLPGDAADPVRAALALNQPDLVGRFMALPLETRDGARGCMLVEANSVSDDTKAMCAVFARQVVQCLENLILYDQATHDTLCRIWNRGAGLQRLDETLKLDNRAGKATSILMLDLDHFKNINDTYGHIAGDIALTQTARLISNSCRETDVVARYGGEEFLVILPTTALKDAGRVAEKIRAALSSHTVTFEQHQIPITASIGVAENKLTTWNADQASELVHRADKALYAAKHAGRNQVKLATDADKP
jgi:two-component system, cell cycle response regulator